MESALPSARKFGLGKVDNFAICVGVGAKAKKRKLDSNYTDEDRYKIAKYAKDHGPNQATRCFESKYPTILGSTVRSFLKKYNEQVRLEKTLNQAPAEPITNLTRSRPLVVGLTVDEKVQKFLMALLKNVDILVTELTY